MGNDPSSVVNTSADETKKIVNQSSGERGQKTIEDVKHNSVAYKADSEDLFIDLAETDSDFDSDYDSDTDSDDDEEDEELMERLRILEDAKQLKFLAAAFLHPEKPVEVDGTACARCYFDRPSAPEQETVGEANYRAMVLADTVALRQAAVDYMHPELGVVTSDGTATARCYFDRPSAPEQESYEEAEERAAILADALALKKLAVDYMHPELGVVTSDGTATARCYFDRASAPEQESYDEAEERAMVLADALALKKLAVDYMHPELGVVTSDGTATARCYFDRPSAPEQESYEQAEERAMVLADAIALKKLAVDYMHPEIGVVTSDTTSTARCYFDRASAPEQESYEEAEERAAILADAIALKKLAVDYMHPELGVVTSDASSTARCYFDRASAPEQESYEEAEERAMVLADALALKKLAVDYMHPEIGVVASDGTATARCYFDRPSAPEQESYEEAEERAMVLADALALKKLAVDYMHPKLGVVTSDGTATARSYFDRASAPAQESYDEADVRAMVLALKKLAVDYMHPELGVVTSDGTATARSYFDRASAPAQESYDEADVRAMVLALKKLTVDYMHPELGVVTSDSTATARSYFDRASAPEQESYDEADVRAMVLALKKLAVDYMERAMVLADALALKKLAVDYMHPELGVVTSDGTATARCYFDRPSAPEQESYEEAEERAMVLADAIALKKLAVDYMHPEIGVVTSDATSTARCYFDRASAPEQESYEEAEERAMVLADALALKKLAVDYMHPEFGVVTSDATSTARCYFDRASAPEQESYEDAEERAAILADALALKKLAVDYMHPEIGVVASDGTATARCYFDRFSASRDSEPTTRNTSQKQQKTAKTLPPTGTATTSSPVVAKHVVTKTITSQIMESTIKKSASTVELYGLDMDHGDDFY